MVGAFHSQVTENAVLASLSRNLIVAHLEKIK
jgi:hypothetical protein